MADNDWIREARARAVAAVQAQQTCALTGEYRHDRTACRLRRSFDALNVSQPRIDRGIARRTTPADYERLP